VPIYLPNGDVHSTLDSYCTVEKLLANVFFAVDFNNLIEKIGNATIWVSAIFFYPRTNYLGGCTFFQVHTNALVKVITIFSVIVYTLYAYLYSIHASAYTTIWYTIYNIQTNFSSGSRIYRSCDNSAVRIAKLQCYYYYGLYYSYGPESSGTIHTITFWKTKRRIYSLIIYTYICTYVKIPFPTHSYYYTHFEFRTRLAMFIIYICI